MQLEQGESECRRSSCEARLGELEQRISSTLALRFNAMKYTNGQHMELSDRVQIANDEVGEVVFINGSINENEKFKKKDWDNVCKGVLVKTKNGALVQFDSDNIELIVKI